MIWMKAYIMERERYDGADVAHLPASLLEKLPDRLGDEEVKGPPVCRGTLLSRAQFRPDIQTAGFRDARLEPRAGLTPRETGVWSEAADDHVNPLPVPPEN